MTAKFLGTWQRPPTEAELKGMIDDMVRGEMAAREAKTMGLDQGDTIIQRRLRQKLEFMVEDLNSTPPTEADLKDWLDNHPESYRIEPRIAFHQVFLNPDKRGSSLDAEAKVLLANLRQAGPEVGESLSGDPLMLPRNIPLTNESGIANQFGQDFTRDLLDLEPGQWRGPIRSAFGLHLVYVDEREEARMPELEEVRAAVERDFLADRRKKALEQMYDSLLERYEVTIEKPKSPEDKEVASTEKAAGNKP
ncbi:MAG: peptidylprolyl isomerase [Desulfuromonadales bacterium]